MGAIACYLAMEFSAADCQSTDIHRFPDRISVLVACQVYDERIAWMQRQQLWHPRDYWNWQDVIDDASRERKAWGELGQAIEEPSCRIEHMQEVRRLIGERRYAAGEMPRCP